MLVIRKEQLQALAAAVASAAEAEAERRLREHFPAEMDALSPSDRLALIRSGRDLAFAHGIQEPDDVHRLLGCMVRFGEAFDGERRVLQRSDLSPSERLDRIEETLRGTDRHREDQR